MTCPSAEAPRVFGVEMRRYSGSITYELPGLASLNCYVVRVGVRWMASVGAVSMGIRDTPSECGPDIEAELIRISDAITAAREAAKERTNGNV